jgi:hypothetical protein
MGTQQVDGLDYILKKIAAMPKNVQESVHQANIKNAEEFDSKLHTTVPKDTGDLDKTIKVIPGRTPLGSGVSVGEGQGESNVAGKAKGIEFGHMDGKTHVPARPFFYPVIRVLAKRWKGRVARAGNKAIKEAVVSDGGD